LSAQNTLRIIVIKNMKTQGYVKIIKRVGDRITQVIEKENLIIRNYYEMLLRWSLPGTLFDHKIFISSNNDAPDFDFPPLTTLPDTSIASTTAQSWIDSIIPPFIQFQAQYPPPGIDVVFQTVGLYDNFGGSVSAYLLLDTPCVQGEDEFLDIFYRVQFTNTGNTTFDSAVYDFAQTLVGPPSTGVTSTILNYPASYYFGAIDPAFLDEYEFPYAPRQNLIDGYPGSFGATNSWEDGVAVNSHFKFKMTASFDALTQQIGKIIKQILIAYNNENYYAYYLDKTNNPQPIQSFFAHSSAATVPFFDSLTAASGNGVISLAGTWNNGFPDLYKITITAGGNTGTATYKLSRRKWLGFDGNTYTDLVVPCPYLNPYKAAANNFHGWRDENAHRLRFSDTKIVQYDDTGVSLLDLLDGSYTTWNSSSTPVLSVTLLRQCAVNDDKIYAACRSTGLWIIDVNTNTITHPITSPCYGVDVGRSDIVFAVVPSGILTSDDGYTTSLDLDVADKSTVLYIKVDPENVNDQAGIVIDTGSSTYQIKWWQKSDESTTDGNVVTVPFPGGFDVSDSGSIWCDGSATHVWGGTTLNGFGVFYFTSKTVTTTLYGSILLYQVQFYNNSIIGFDGLYDEFGVQVVAYIQSNLIVSPFESPFVVHMVDGIIATSEYMRQLFTDNVYCWRDFGWNASAWIEGNSNSKTTHTGVQDLIDGITIAFANGDSPPAWVNTDYYTFAGADALVKDNATTLFIEHNWYSAPASYATISTTIPGGLEITIPEAVTASFITLEVDSPRVHEFEIDSSPVTLVRGDGSSPAPNEVTVYADGRIQFNAADIGKTFSGRYLYVKI
jgi:hypothetical protein